jgi:hypothetical protein
MVVGRFQALNHVRGIKRVWLVVGKQILGLGQLITACLFALLQEQVGGGCPENSTYHCMCASLVAADFS